MGEAIRWRPKGDEFAGLEWRYDPDLPEYVDPVAILVGGAYQTGEVIEHILFVPRNLLLSASELDVYLLIRERLSQEGD